MVDTLEVEDRVPNQPALHQTPTHRTGLQKGPPLCMRDIWSLPEAILITVTRENGEPSSEVPVLKHVVLPDAGSPCVGDTSPEFPRLGAE